MWFKNKEGLSVESWLWIQFGRRRNQICISCSPSNWWCLRERREPRWWKQTSLYKSHMRLKSNCGSRIKKTSPLIRYLPTIGASLWLTKPTNSLAKEEENQGQTCSYQSQGQLQRKPSNVQEEEEGPWGITLKRRRHWRELSDQKGRITRDQGDRRRWRRLGLGGGGGGREPFHPQNYLFGWMFTKTKIFICQLLGDRLPSWGG
jgi:hypothetical protein